MRIGGPVYGILQTEVNCGSCGLLCLFNCDSQIGYTPIMITKEDAEKKLRLLNRTSLKDQHAKYNFKVIEVSIDTKENVI